MASKKIAKLGDKDLRHAFIKNNKDFFKKHAFVNEFGLNKRSIIDLASFDFKGNIFYGFEIKSEKDNLKRLFRQLTSYLTLFNIVYVVCHSSHLKGVLELINSYKHLEPVGIIETSSTLGDELEFKEYRKAVYNVPKYHNLITAIDKESLYSICEDNGVSTEGMQVQVVSRAKRFLTLENVYEGIEKKFKKYYYKKCEVCGCEMYYNKLVNKNKHSYCYECGNIIISY